MATPCAYISLTNPSAKLHIFHEICKLVTEKMFIFLNIGNTFIKNANIFFIMEGGFTIKSRAKHYIDTTPNTITSLSDGSESLRTTLSRQINGSVGISLSTVSLLLEKCPDLSAEWLLRGEGAISISEIRTPKIYTQGGSVNTGNANDHSSISMGVDKDGKNMYERLLDEQEAHYSDLLAEKDKRINELTEYIGTFKMFVAAITPAPRIKK